MTNSATTPLVTRTALADISTVGDVLARAFQDDPVFTWVIPDPDRRRDLLPSVFAEFARVFLPHDETYLTDDGAGAALWAPAGVDAVGPDQAEAFGERLAAIVGDDAARVAELDALLEQHHPAESCFYLQFLGVVPGQQGQGIGSRMLTAVLRRCDASGTPAYLEATSPENRRLYQRHGFAVVREITVPDGPALWPMWREPAA